ncbi:FAD-dependent oxidoreductase [Microlunatus elymi]|uniref:FAD-dependent oxidoreductase n=1 Tax=Microlunatus elymi TaxID=2596828 RepID=A0A516PW21_9ACTN|nr:FAD-dependent oxidoreductase [Microlunatus elymi]QDP95386.1 FAD-dependent oxidoreductase [Microlunatus elymi]
MSLTSTTAATAETVECDVAVIGGGLGGIAAALAAAAAGQRVVLTCDQPVLGGQITSQLVPALDEHPYVETFGSSASYRRFRDLIRSRYDGVANPGGGWVSRLCFESSAGLSAIEEMLNPYIATGQLTVLLDISPALVLRDGARISAVELTGAAGIVQVRANMFCDATETGDLLPLSDAAWVVGSEGRDAYGESLAIPGGPRPGAVQSCTVGFVVEHDPDGNYVGQEPPGYRRWRDSQPFTLEIAGADGQTHRYRMFTEGPDGRPPFWTYRRLRDGATLGGRDLALINWSSNDYAARSLIHEPDLAHAEARDLSLSFLHWLRTECPRDDGGHGYPGLRLVPVAAGTPDGLAAQPYVRESRRLRLTQPITEHDLLRRPGHARATQMPDSGGIALYNLDLHARVGYDADSTEAPIANVTSAPFQVPLHALVTDEPANLLMAAKNLAATQVAAGAYRVHNGEWAVGEAAGTLAAQAVARNLAPHALLNHPHERHAVQRALLRGGVPITWIEDIEPDDPLYVPAQLLVTAGGLGQNRAASLRIEPQSVADESDRIALRDAANSLLGGEPVPENALPPAGSSWAEVVRSLAPALDRAVAGT